MMGKRGMPGSIVMDLYGISYSLWSKIVATLWMMSKLFLGEFQNCKKSTQALSVYRKGTVCVYNEFLIKLHMKL